jgi:thioredoxin-dependent peroxiredoxin
MSEPLKIGERAPQFRATTDAGTQIALEDFRGKNVVLYFFPKAMTPG